MGDVYQNSVPLASGSDLVTAETDQPTGKTAPLIDGFLHPFGHPRISIDRVTIVGQLKKPVKFLNRWQSNTDVGEMKIAKFPYRHMWQSVANYIVQQKDPDADVPMIRIEFNPNTLCYSQSFFQIICNLYDQRVTRLDFAADYPFSLKDYKFSTLVPKKSRSFYSRSGDLETHYIGHRSSGSEYRIYDKQKESKLNHTFWRIEHEKHFGKDEDWRDFVPFSDLQCYGGDYSSIANLSDRAMLFYLAANPSAWGELHHKKKKRLRDLIPSISGDKLLTPHPVELFYSKQEKLSLLVCAFINPAMNNQPVPF